MLYRGCLLEAADVRSFFANPRHPYSIELLSAFSYGLPSGAAMIPSVPYDAEELEVREVAPGHLVRDVG